MGLKRIFSDSSHKIYNMKKIVAVKLSNFSASDLLVEKFCEVIGLFNEQVQKNQQLEP